VFPAQSAASNQNATVVSKQNPSVAKNLGTRGKSGLVQRVLSPMPVIGSGLLRRSQSGIGDKNLYIHSWHRCLFFCDHLITLSARYSIDCGIVRPICLAVFRLITSSNFVGCSTGRSAGLAPLRILST